MVGATRVAVVGVKPREVGTSPVVKQTKASGRREAAAMTIKAIGVAEVRGATKVMEVEQATDVAREAP